VIDFAALALGPGIAAFGRPVTVTPNGGRPPIPPFPATGVWTSRVTEVVVGPDETMNSRVLTLGIALAAWPVPPRQGWAIRVPAAGSLVDEGSFWIDHIDLDGQGGATLTLKNQQQGA